MRPFIARGAGITLTALALFACGRKPQPQLPVAEPTTPPPASPVQPSAEDEARRAREREEERLRAEIARLRSALEQMVFFDYDRAEVRLDSRSTLDAKVPILRERPDIRLRIEGHADERGSAEYNLALGLRRAQNVRTYLANFGIDVSRIDVVTIGEERPLSTGNDEAAYARNRRAEFRIMAGLATASPDTQR